MADSADREHQPDPGISPGEASWPQEPLPIAGALRAAQRAGLPALEARLLLSHVTGLRRTQLLTQDERMLTYAEHAEFSLLVSRRTNGEPIAYLLGTREFFGLTFRVTPAVLIPRPETELLVEWVMRHCRDMAAPNIADLGTGSGAIAISVARQLPHARVHAADISPSAIAVAQDNAKSLLSAGTHISFSVGSWYDALPENVRMDVIVSNPPYIAAGDEHLLRGDLRFEPSGALTDGLDGLSALRALVAGGPAHLIPGGWLLLEHGHDQADPVRRMMTDAGFHGIDSLRDLAGIERITLGQWQGNVHAGANESAHG